MHGDLWFISCLIIPILVSYGEPIQNIAYGLPLGHETIHQSNKALVVRGFEQMHHLMNDNVFKAFLRLPCSQGIRLLVRCEVTAGQMLDLEAEFAQPFMRELDLSVFKGIFVTAAHEERELIAISLEEVTQVEPVTLRFVISHEARCGGEVEQAT